MRPALGRKQEHIGGISMEKQSELVFERDTKSVAGFGSANRPSTDAINALLQWQSRAPGRSYIEIDGDGEILRAQIMWDSDDGAAGDDLDFFSNQVGVKRRRATAE
jgi:hypothetical protein